MAGFKPILIKGNWSKGYALDLQTIRSDYIGHDEYGIPQFDTIRPEIGELLFKLKYRSDLLVIPELVKAAASFVRSWKPDADVIVPVPPSRRRKHQPVMLLGEPIANALGLPFAKNWLRKIKDFPEIKNVYEYGERVELLTGAYDVDKAKVEGRRILLFDDLFRSGATMNTITELLYNKGGAKMVYALTITRARRKK